jgi:hypothetical protein
MLKPSHILVLAVVLLCLFNSCSKSTKNETKYPDPVSPPIEGTPKENEEAELMAICLSGELIAPDSLYEQIVTDLEAIRSQFGDSIEMVNKIKFMPTWWMPNCLLINFDDTTGEKILLGEYDAWDELNLMYKVTQIKTRPVIPGFGCLVSLSFEGRFHPCHLAEQYRVLPGVMFAEPNGIEGDGSNVYARQIGNDITYLFRLAYGDCPAGCISSEFWYFVFNQGEPEYLGYFKLRRDPEPEWWEEAEQNWENHCGKDRYLNRICPN